MMLHTVRSEEDFNQTITTEKAVLCYFSHETCNVCKVLKPKINELLDAVFPEIKMLYVDINNTPLIAGQQRIFTVPTISVWFEGKEYIRKSRNISMQELKEELQRPYSMLFDL